MGLRAAMSSIDGFLDRHHNHTIALLLAASLAARLFEGSIDWVARAIPRGDACFLLLFVFVIAVLWFRDGLRE